METSLPFERKALMFRSQSLAEFSPTKAASVQQAFSQPCSLIRHMSCEQIFLGPKRYSVKRSVTEEVNILKPNESNVKESQDCDDIVLKGTESKPINAENLFLPEPVKNNSAFEQEAKKNVIESKMGKRKKPAVRNLVGESFETSTMNKRGCLFYILLPLIVVICTSLPFYYNSQPWSIPPDLRVCREVIPDVTSLKEALEKNMFGQQNAISEIVDLLRIFYTSRYPEVKVFALAGGIGVGKSYMSSLLTKYFPWKHNVEHLFWPVHHKQVSGPELYKKLSFCGVNLIIIDDIGISEANNAIELVKQVAEYSRQDHIRTILVLVFNFLESQQNISFKDILDVTSCKQHMKKIFQPNRLESEIICFENLEEYHIRKCIETAALEKGIDWSSERTNEVLSLLVANTGCKGVNSKLQLLHNEECRNSGI